MDEEIYQTGGKRKPKDKTLVTTITSEDKLYYLYDDGFIYEKNEKGELQRLDNLNSQSKAIIDRIMSKFGPGKTDIYQNHDERN